VSASADRGLLGAAHVDYRARRYVLGRTGEVYAIWDGAVGGSPIETFALSTDGWVQAWERFQALEDEADRAPVSPAAPYPLTVGQIVGGGFRLWTRHFWPLAAMSALLVIPAYAVVVPLTLSTMRVVSPAGGPSAVVVPAWVEIVGNLLYAVVYAWVGGAVIRAGVLAVQGLRPSVGDSYRAMRRRAGTLALVAVVAGLAVAAPLFPGLVVLALAEPGDPAAVLGVILLLAGAVPAVFLAMRFLLATGVAVIEGRRGLAPMARSWSLVRGLTWRTLGAVLLVALIIFGAGLVLFAVVFAIFAATAGEATEALLRSLVVWTGIASALVLTATLPLANVVIALLYVDSRVRKEGLSFDTLGRETSGDS
jgi:hypothetical protein